jgi:hypothetical protein
MDEVPKQTKADTPQSPEFEEQQARKEENEARKRDFQEAVRKTRPKDALDGLGSGLGTAAVGIISGRREVLVVSVLPADANSVKTV